MHPSIVAVDKQPEAALAVQPAVVGGPSGRELATRGRTLSEASYDPRQLRKTVPRALAGRSRARRRGRGDCPDLVGETAQSIGLSLDVLRLSTATEPAVRQ